VPDGTCLLVSTSMFSFLWYISTWYSKFYLLIWIHRMSLKTHRYSYSVDASCGHPVCPTTDQPVHAVAQFCLASLMMSSWCHDHVTHKLWLFSSRKNKCSVPSS
jgi:hypothetical protein